MKYKDVLDALTPKPQRDDALFTKFLNSSN